MTYHISFSLSVLEMAANDGISLLEVDGKAIPVEDTLKRVQEQKDKGFQYWPVCEEVDEVGKCQGHEED